MTAKKGLTLRRRWCARLGLLAWLALPGRVADKEHCHGCADIPTGAIRMLTGTHTKNILRTQAEIAEADDFVIYEHEWAYDPATHLGSTRLGPYGTSPLTQ